jgi:multiple sugar transport system ATP-binding protein
VASVGFRAIRKSFGETQVLSDVSLEVGDGEFVALVGPSGCGKTTLLRILAGLESQDTGEVRIGEHVVDELPPKARDIAMVFQSYALYPYMTVAENMAMPLIMRRLTSAQRLPLVGRLLAGAGPIRATISEEVGNVADALGIAHLLGRKPGQLSGGQKQRVALGRAMVRHPAAFLMDEPLSNLDAKMRVQARAEIADLHRRIGGTFIYVTHDQVEAMTMSDRVAVMLEGRLLQVAPPQELYADPCDLRVAEFIGSPKINVVGGIVGADRTVSVLAETLPLRVECPVGGRVSVAVRPESIALGVDGHPCRVRHVEHLGADLYVHVDPIGVDHSLIVRADPDRFRSVKSGDSIGISLATPRAFVFGEDGGRVAATPIEASSRLARAL